jgi:hypothetical protein
MNPIAEPEVTDATAAQLVDAALDNLITEIEDPSRWPRLAWLMLSSEVF